MKIGRFDIQIDRQSFLPTLSITWKTSDGRSIPVSKVFSRKQLKTQVSPRPEPRSLQSYDVARTETTRPHLKPVLEARLHGASLQGSADALRPLLTELGQLQASPREKAELLKIVCSPRLNACIQDWLQAQANIQCSTAGDPAAFLDMLSEMRQFTPELLPPFQQWLNTANKPLPEDQGRFQFLSASLHAQKNDLHAAKASLQQAMRLLPHDTPFYGKACLELRDDLREKLQDRLSEWPVFGAPTSPSKKVSTEESVHRTSADKEEVAGSLLPENSRDLNKARTSSNRTPETEASGMNTEELMKQDAEAKVSPQPSSDSLPPATPDAENENKLTRAQLSQQIKQAVADNDVDKLQVLFIYMLTHEYTPEQLDQELDYLSANNPALLEALIQWSPKPGEQKKLKIIGKLAYLAISAHFKADKFSEALKAIQALKAKDNDAPHEFKEAIQVLEEQSWLGHMQTFQGRKTIPEQVKVLEALRQSGIWSKEIAQFGIPIMAAYFRELANDCMDEGKFNAAYHHLESARKLPEPDQEKTNEKFQEYFQRQINDVLFQQRATLEDIQEITARLNLLQHRGIQSQDLSLLRMTLQDLETSRLTSKKS